MINCSAGHRLSGRGGIGPFTRNFAGRKRSPRDLAQIPLTVIGRLVCNCRRDRLELKPPRCILRKSRRERSGTGRDTTRNIGFDVSHQRNDPEYGCYGEGKRRGRRRRRRRRKETCINKSRANRDTTEFLQKKKEEKRARSMYSPFHFQFVHVFPARGYERPMNNEIG